MSCSFVSLLCQAWSLGTIVCLLNERRATGVNLVLDMGRWSSKIAISEPSPAISWAGGKDCVRPMTRTQEETEGRIQAVSLWSYHALLVPQCMLSHSVAPDSLRVHGPRATSCLCPWNSLSKNTIPFSRGSSQPKDTTQASYIQGRSFAV